MAAGFLVDANPEASRSPVLGGYSFDVQYLTDSADPTTDDEFPAGLNTLTLTGFQQDFVLRGVNMQVYTGDTATAAAAYGCVDVDNIVKYTDTSGGHNPTIATVPVYVSAEVVLVRLWVY